MMISSLKSASLVLLMLLAGSGAVASENPREASPQPPLEVMVSQDPANPDSLVQVAKTSVSDATISDLGEVLERLPKDKDIVVSTDSLEVAEEVARERVSDNSNRLLRLIPLGPLKGAIEGTKKLARTVGASARADKIGFTLMILNNSYDTYIWIHATQYSPEVRAAQIIYITMLSLLFSVDKDRWSRTSRKIQGKMVRFLDPALIGADGTVTPSKLGYLTSYASHILLSLLVQTGRVGILAYDAVVNVPFITNAAASALALSFIYSFTHYAWSEFSANVDAVKNPAAKFFVRRFAETRSAVMGVIAPSGKVLQPEVHGYTPWFALATSGVAGLIALANSKTIIPWLESRKSLQWIQKRATNMEDGIRSLIPFGRSRTSGPGGALSCSALFAG